MNKHNYQPRVALQGKCRAKETMGQVRTGAKPREMIGMHPTTAKCVRSLWPEAKGALVQCAWAWQALEGAIAARQEAEVRLRGRPKFIMIGKTIARHLRVVQPTGKEMFLRHMSLHRSQCQSTLAAN